MSQYSKVLLKIIDKFKGYTVSERYNFFQQTTNWNQDQIEEYQILRMNQLLDNSIKNVPYYTELFTKNNSVDFRIKDLSDLKKINKINREIIQKSEKKLLTKNISQYKVIRGSSSGTTGIPLNYYNDQFGISSGTAAAYTMFNFTGWEFGQKTVHIWGNESSIKQWSKKSSIIKNKLINQKNIPSTLLNKKDNLDAIAESIIKFNPINLDGYTSSIYTLAKHFQKKNIKLKNLKRVLTTAENIEHYQQELIENVFAPISDLYGSGEVLGVALKPYPINKYYIFDPHVIVETEENEKTGFKNIILTDLDNYVMPLMRYEIGDMIDNVHSSEHNSKIPFKYFNKIIGRTSDVIELANGNKFHPINIFGGTLFREFKEITKHKVIWDGKTLEFIFETIEEIDYNSLNEKIKVLVNPFNINYKITITDNIPLSDGKYKFLEIKK